MKHHDRPAPVLTAMLEGSFACLIWLSAIAFAAPVASYRNLAVLAIGAISISIAVMLALPTSWVRRTSAQPTAAPTSAPSDPSPEPLATANAIAAVTREPTTAVH